MARLKGTHLGLVSGKLGDTVFKNRKGTQYISAAPEYKKPTGEVADKNRNIFGLTAMMFSALGKNYLIKNIWDNWTGSKGNYVNKLKKFNDKSLKANPELANVTFIPSEKLFLIELVSASMENKTINVTIQKSADIQFYFPDSRCSMQGVIQGIKEAEEIKNGNLFRPVSSPDVFNVNDNELSFTMTLTDTDVKELAEFTEKFLYLNIIVKDSTGTPHEYSTVVKADLS